jgi:hypothetical protein
MLSATVKTKTHKYRAYNDLCYLCEKYAPTEGLEKYDKAKDPTIAMWR